jgi:hypothetical protein
MAPPMEMVPLISIYGLMTSRERCLVALHQSSVGTVNYTVTIKDSNGTGC